MLYAVHARDAAGTLALRHRAQTAHRRYLEALEEEGCLLLAGSHPVLDCEEAGSAGFSGSLVVAEFDSLEAAREWADADPYVAAGVYAEVRVEPFLRELP